MAVNNSTILDRVWLEGSNDYQQRVPRETVNDMDATVSYLFAPENFDLYNQFVSVLVNRIGATYVHQQAWRNPLAGFKKADLRWGDKLEEIAVKWVRSHSYSDIPDVEKLFGDYRPESAVWFHKINRQEYYPITVNREELMMAFAGDGESEGLNNYIAQIMEVPISSDEYDEYRIMLELFAYYEHKMGFFKRNLTSIPSDIVESADSAKMLLKMVKADAGRLAFPSSRYHADVPELRDYPVFARPEELIFLTTPEVRAAIDVDALMGAFHMEKGDIQERIVLVDEFPMAGVGAVLTTRDFFQCRDRLRQNTSRFNELTLSTNFFLHRWGMYSVSPVAPAICYTTDEGTAVLTSKQTVTGMTMTPTTKNVSAGDTVQLKLTLTGNITNNGDGVFEVQPDAATFLATVKRTSGAGASATITGVNSPKTRVDRNGVLHIADNLHTGDVITVTATSAYINPSGNTTTYTASSTFTLDRNGSN